MADQSITRCRRQIVNLLGMELLGCEINIVMVLPRQLVRWPHQRRACRSHPYSCFRYGLRYDRPPTGGHDHEAGWVYLRVSTDNQTTDYQRRELEAVAARSGWDVVGIYEDAGITGAKGREQRPDFDVC